MFPYDRTLKKIKRNEIKKRKNSTNKKNKNNKQKTRTWTKNQTVKTSKPKKATANTTREIHASQWIDWHALSRLVLFYAIYWLLAIAYGTVSQWLSCPSNNGEIGCVPIDRWNHDLSAILEGEITIFFIKAVDISKREKRAMTFSKEVKGGWIVR